ncbi:MAG: hypothetical protein AMJ46_01870 [Latescibacteria bacterium DG_63]|nr:MAG: hypothetical protein AMJ46_01870 [Latescibacteria bacterium DG_63]
MPIIRTYCYIAPVLVFFLSLATGCDKDHVDTPLPPHMDKIVVKPDGSGDYSTIQAAVDAAEDGQWIDLYEGRFSGSGNRNINLRGKAITIFGVTRPTQVVIDCEGLGRAFICQSGGGTSIWNVDIVNGFADRGGAVFCDSSSSPSFLLCSFSFNVATNQGGVCYAGAGCSPRFSDCEFRRNSAPLGGVLYCTNASPVLSGSSFVDNVGTHGASIYCLSSDSTIALTLSGCRFSGNAASVEGGAVWCRGASLLLTSCVFTGNSALAAGGGLLCLSSARPTLESCTFSNNYSTRGGGAVWCSNETVSTFISCTFYGNSAAFGGALYLNEPTVFSWLDRCVVAFCPKGEAVFITGSGLAVLNCCDLYGNAGGDWIGSYASQLGVRGNVSKDPLFCSPESGDFRLLPESPCGSDSTGCGNMGAWPVGCESQSYPETYAANPR